MMQPDVENSERKLTSFGPGFRYQLYWSPDSKKLAFIDKAMTIMIHDVAAGQTTKVDKALRFSHGNLNGFTPSWSPDSRWLAYSRDLENYHRAIFITTIRTKNCSRQHPAFTVVPARCLIPKENISTSDGAIVSAYLQQH
jgi:tricorn protease